MNELIRRELDTAISRAVETGESISAGEFESINRLAKMIELRNSIRTKPRNWWPPMVLACTLGIVSLLLFARIRETEIELDLSLANVTFSLAKDEALTNTARLLSLGVSGARAVQLPDGASGPPEASTAVSLVSQTAGERHGSVTLAPVLLAADTRVTIRQSEGQRQFQLLPGMEALLVRAAIEGPVALAVSGSPARVVDSPIPKSVVFAGGKQDLVLNLTFPTPIRSPFSSQLEIRDLSLFSIDQFLEPNQAIVRRISTVLSGVLYFESLNGEERRLRPGEDLYFSQSQGEIRTLELTDDHIGLKFHGHVSGMTIGANDGLRSIMPTYLEWLRARHGLSLLWGTSLYAFALLAGALRWCGVRI